jgi:lysophospholipase L1-like esterase
VSTASGKASEASASATAAAQSASSAASASQSAVSSASSAQSSATDAEQAKTDAQTAKTAAETAQAAAEAAAQSVSASAAQIAKNTANFASEFSASTTYAIGDYCIHEGTLYRFTSAHTGAWSASDVEATNVGYEVDDLKSDISLDRESVSVDVPISATYTSRAYIDTGISVGSTVSLTPVSHSDLSYAIIDVNEGDYFKIIGAGASAPRQWAFIDSSNKLLAVSAAGVSTTSYVHAPKDGKLIVNTWTTDPHSVSYSGYKGYVETIDAEITDITNGIVAINNSIDFINDAVFDTVLTPLSNDVLNLSANTYLYVDTLDYSVEARTLSGASTTDYLEIPTDGVVSVETTYGSAVCGASYYDASKVCIGVESDLYGGASPVTVSNYALADIPSGAKYFRISSWYDDISVSENVLIPKTETEIIKPNIYGKTWLCVGDSLTAGPSSSKYYHDYISEKDNVSVVNLGRGGTGYMNDYETGNAFYQRIIPQTSDIDFATVFGSGNDLNHYSVLGNYTDTTTDTICGCVNTFLDNYFANYPTQPIGMIAPTPWKDYPTTTPNNQMEQYVEKLRQIAEYRGVPFLDLYHHSNLRPENATNREALFYHQTLDGNGDGVHPNAEGHKIIASKIEQFIKGVASF